MPAPGFWDDQERAARVSAEHAGASRRLESYRSLERDVDDLDALEEMAAEDESIAAELDEQRASIEAGSPSSRRRACSAASTTAATPWSPSTPAPAAPTRRTGPRCCCAWRCAGPSAAA